MSPQNPLPLQVRTFESCDSTNYQLLEAAEAGASGGLVYVAREQSAGRGRRGRQWLAAPGASLTFSLLWVFPPDPARLQGLSLLIGLAVVRAVACWPTAQSQLQPNLQHKPGTALGLKWPNDLLIRRADGVDVKAGGILIESVIRRSATGERELAVVIGIGLNCLADAAIAEGVQGQAAATPAVVPAGALSELFVDATDARNAPTPDHFLPHLLDTLTPILADFSATGFESFVAEWNAHNLWQGRPVEICEEHKVVLQGRCDGVDASGALRIMTPAGLEQIVSGDVSLRKV